MAYVCSIINIQIERESFDCDFVAIDSDGLLPNCRVHKSFKLEDVTEEFLNEQTASYIDLIMRVEE